MQNLFGPTMVRASTCLSIGICLTFFYPARSFASGVAQTETAILNLRTLEASQMVYDVYEYFIVPRICKEKDFERTKLGKKKLDCRLLKFTDRAKMQNAFSRHTKDTTGILFDASESVGTKVLGLKDKKTLPEMKVAAPKDYILKYVGCYRRAETREAAATDCTLFFTIHTSLNGRPPILAVKGTSNAEDLGSDLDGGARVLKEITGVFIGVFANLKFAVTGEEKNQIPAEFKSLAPLLSNFFRNLSGSKILFTGHSLGGALAQELGREIFLATRENGSGPRVKVVTWNSLSYTSMLGRLRSGLGKVIDPLVKAGWKKSHQPMMEEYKKYFDGDQLSAVNFHTSDDILTNAVNYGFFGRVLRLKSQRNEVQAGADVLLPTDRNVSSHSISAGITGHRTATLLGDALFAMGGVKLANGEIVGRSRKDMMQILDDKSQVAARNRKHKLVNEYNKMINSMIDYPELLGHLDERHNYNRQLQTEIYPSPPAQPIVDSKVPVVRQKIARVH
jgi:hypothetical protein